MDKFNLIILIALGLTILLLIYFALKIKALYHNIDKSFSKLGFIIREDAKKYFNSSISASFKEKQQLEEENRQIIQRALTEALENQRQKSAEILIAANSEAKQIVAQAEERAKQIVAQAEDQAKEVEHQILEKMTLIVKEALAEYVKQNYSQDEQEKIISAFINKINSTYDEKEK